MKEVWEKLSARCWYPLSVDCHRIWLFLPRRICNNVCKVLSTMDIPELCPGFLLGEPCKHLVSAWLTSDIQTSRPPEQKQVVTINYIVSINHLVILVRCGPRPQEYRNTYQTDYFKSFIPKSWLKSSPGNRPFLGKYSFRETQPCWVNLLLYTTLWVFIWCIYTPDVWEIFC